MDEIRKQLKQAGARRERARRTALDASDEIARLAPQALDAGLTKREVAQLARVSRPALDEMLKS